MKTNRKTLVGRIISDKMDKTVIVAVESRKQHPVYKRTIKTLARFKAHDEENACHLGDIVRIVESRPISKEKTWAVQEILRKGDVAEIQPSAI